MDFLGPFHPIIVHTPIALIVFSFLFDVVGRLADSSWWRKAAVSMLVVGVLGGVAAILSGEPASEVAEHKQGIPEERVEAHEDVAKMAVWLGGGALAARALAAAMPGSRAVVTGLAFLLHLASAVSVGLAGYRGGLLVYKYGAGVRVDGQLIRHSAHGDALTETRSGAGNTHSSTSARRTRPEATPGPVTTSAEGN